MLAIVGLIAGEYPWLTSVRHVAYAILQKAIQRPDADIVVVLIGDDEYNGPRLQNRVPLRRDYLADLITKIRAGNPRAIAVDVDLHSPDPARAMIQPDYVAETTTGYWYPERWGLQQLNVGVYRWVKLPAEFRRK